MARNGFPPAVRATVIEREGFRCARCGDLGAQVHHRRPRGMGGAKHRPATNDVANGVLLCVGCHDWAENNREAARAEGLLLTPEQVPSRSPVLYRGEWMLLDNDGSLTPTGPPT